MTSDLSPGRATLAGGAVLMACACGVATRSARAVGLTGVASTTTLVQALPGAGHRPDAGRSGPGNDRVTRLGRSSA